MKSYMDFDEYSMQTFSKQKIQLNFYIGMKKATKTNKNKNKQKTTTNKKTKNSGIVGYK